MFTCSTWNSMRHTSSPPVKINKREIRPDWGKSRWLRSIEGDCEIHIFSPTETQKLTRFFHTSHTNSQKPNLQIQNGTTICGSHDTSVCIPNGFQTFNYSCLHVKLPTCFGKILWPDQIMWLFVPRFTEFFFFWLDCDSKSQNWVWLGEFRHILENNVGSLTCKRL
jgi:hypothetical protein